MTKTQRPIAHRIDANQPHPVEIGLIPNTQFGTVDLCVMIGNFKTKHEAERFAARLVEVLGGEGMTLRKQ